MMLKSWKAAKDFIRRDRAEDSQAAETYSEKRREPYGCALSNRKCPENDHIAALLPWAAGELSGFAGIASTQQDAVLTLTFSDIKQRIDAVWKQTEKWDAAACCGSS